MVNGQAGGGLYVTDWPKVTFLVARSNAVLLCHEPEIRGLEAADVWKHDGKISACHPVPRSERRRILLDRDCRNPAAPCVGIARAAYARTLSVLTRLHGPNLPDEHTFVLADLRGRILQGRLLLQAVARRADADPNISPGLIGIMKQACTDLGFHASVQATRILGPYGDLTVFGAERCLRDAKVTQIYDGTNEIQRLLIGRETIRAWKGLQ